MELTELEAREVAGLHYYPEEEWTMDEMTRVFRKYSPIWHIEADRDGDGVIALCGEVSLYRTAMAGAPQRPSDVMVVPDADRDKERFCRRCLKREEKR